MAVLSVQWKLQFQFKYLPPSQQPGISVTTCVCIPLHYPNTHTIVKLDFDNEISVMNKKNRSFSL